MLDGQGYDISCDLVMKVSVGCARTYTHQQHQHTEIRAANAISK